MSIKEQDPRVQSVGELPRAHFLMSDGAEIEIFVRDSDGLSGTARAWAEWGGWQWSAEGENADIAMRTLIERLHRRDPFYSDGLS
jgi:hypothetical protein